MNDPGCCEPGAGALLEPGFGREARRLASAGFASLWANRLPVSPGDVSADGPRVAAALAAAGRAELDDAGRLVGIHGLTLRLTRHSFTHEGVIRNTWCAFDSIGIPAALDLDAVASTDCPTCGRAIHVPLAAGRVDPGAAVLWLPEVDSPAHLMNEFCAAADLYCSREHLDQRIQPTSASGRVIELDEAASLGREAWADVARVGGAPASKTDHS
jgi:alkylmercury lyase